MNKFFLLILPETDMVNINFTGLSNQKYNYNRKEFFYLKINK